MKFIYIGNVLNHHIYHYYFCLKNKITNLRLILINNFGKENQI